MDGKINRATRRRLFEALVRDVQERKRDLLFLLELRLGESCPSEGALEGDMKALGITYGKGGHANDPALRELFPECFLTKATITDVRLASPGQKGDER